MARQATALKETPTPAIRKASSLGAQSVIVVVHHELPGNERQADKALVNVGNADKDAFRINKKLLDCPEYRALESYEGHTRYCVQKLCLPFWFRNGAYTLPLAKLDECEALLKKRHEGWVPLVRAFLKVYPQAIEQAKVDLKEHFNPKEYPSLDEVARRFAFEWYYLEFKAPDSLKKAKKALWDKARKNIADKLVDTERECEQYLYNQLKKLVDHAVSRLAVDESGKALVFKASTIDNLAKFIEEFKDYNLGNYENLEALVERARTALADVPDAQVLRDDKEFRAEVRGRFEALATSIGELAIEAPRRAIIF